MSRCLVCSGERCDWRERGALKTCLGIQVRDYTIGANMSMLIYYCHSYLLQPFTARCHLVSQLAIAAIMGGDLFPCLG